MDEVARRLRILHPLLLADPVVAAAVNRRLESATSGLDLAGASARLAAGDRDDIPRAD